MKNVRYRQAIVSFCPELTNPSASAVPVATMLLAESDTGMLAATGTAAHSLMQDRKLDPISKELLGDIQKLLRRHIDAAAAAATSKPGDSNGDWINAVLDALHHSLRNSLHVSEVFPMEEAELSDLAKDEVQDQLVKLMVNAFIQRVVPRPETERSAPKRLVRFILGRKARARDLDLVRDSWRIPATAPKRAALSY